MTLRVILLRSDGAHHRFLEMLLAENFDLIHVVEESEKNQIRRLRKKGKWMAWAWRQYHTARRVIMGTAAYRRRYFEQIMKEPMKDAPTSQVEWINDPTTTDVLLEKKADIIIVIGTSILRKQVLEDAGATILNIHGGWLPDYRGNHCYFFAQYFRDWKKIGSTIHQVNSGVDTGDIVDHIKPSLDVKKYSAESLYCDGERLAFYRLIEILKELERGIPLTKIPQPQDMGRTFRSCDRKPFHELSMFLRYFFLRNQEKQ